MIKFVLLHGLYTGMMHDPVLLPGGRARRVEARRGADPRSRATVLPLLLMLMLMLMLLLLTTTDAAAPPPSAAAAAAAVAAATTTTTNNNNNNNWSG